MKVLERVVKSAGAPNKTDLWLDDSGEQLKLKVYHNGSWVEVCHCEDDGFVPGNTEVLEGPPSINF